MNFCILSSRTVRPSPYLAPRVKKFQKFKKKIFKNFDPKSKKYKFAENFRNFLLVFLLHFSTLSARSRRVLDRMEGKIKKFVDTAENEPVQISSDVIKVQLMYVEALNIF